ncbi:MAG: methionyl-tRNA formyltransferase [Gammaproteobacteria bacterium]|nr:methionyl-tRNA formyltransferase [Gammaproteobacteria bacterium]
MRLIFAGTPDFAATVLAALVDSRHQVLCAYTQPDRPAGRGRRPRASAVKSLAAAHAIRVEQPASLRGKAAAEAVAALDADAMVVAAYGLLLPEALLTAPRLGCINVHASLLPRWRGAAPVQHAILAGDPRSGVSIMQMDAGLDTGPVLRRAALDIAGDETAASLEKRLADLGARTLVETLDALDGGHLSAEPQDEALATHAGRIAKQDACIDWREPACLIERRVRAYNPWPVAYTHVHDAPAHSGEPGGARLRIWQADVVRGAHGARSAAPGTVVASAATGIDVATGGEVLRILALQPAGKRRMSSGEYLNAHALPPGTRLGEAHGRDGRAP